VMRGDALVVIAGDFEQDEMAKARMSRDVGARLKEAMANDCDALEEVGRRPIPNAWWNMLL
jgi:hypothetical protein